MRLSATAVLDGWPSARASGCTEPGLQASSADAPAPACGCAVMIAAWRTSGAQQNLEVNVGRLLRPGRIGWRRPVVGRRNASSARPLGIPLSGLPPEGRVPDPIPHAALLAGRLRKALLPDRGTQPDRRAGSSRSAGDPESDAP